MAIGKRHRNADGSGCRRRFDARCARAERGHRRLQHAIISALLIRLTQPKGWLEAARDHAEEGAEAQEEDFDWHDRIRSKEGWQMVGHHFV